MYLASYDAKADKNHTHEKYTLPFFPMDDYKSYPVLDLNNYTTIGLYRLTGETAYNTPWGSPGSAAPTPIHMHLTVFSQYNSHNGANWIRQECRALTAHDHSIYVRYWNLAEWTIWTAVYTHELTK